MKATVDQDEYKYFVTPSVTLNESNKLVILLTPYSGDADIYVSNKDLHQPKKDNCQWKSVDIGGGMIEIERSQPNYKDGPFHIGIYGYKGKAAFTVTAYLSDGLCND